jgi:uncharacterized protein
MISTPLKHSRHAGHRSAGAPYDRLAKRLRRLHKLAVAFSGGVDSSLLLAMAVKILGPRNVIALTAAAPYIPAWEIREARAFARSLGVRHLVVKLPMSDAVVMNPPNRCYLCKHTVFRTLINQARAKGFTVVADGTNADDANDYRPGMQALKELGVISPLLESGITKANVRTLSKQHTLPTWDKPAYACLLSRIPYNTRVTKRALRMIEQAERFLMDEGFRMVRVRHHDTVARIETDAAALTALLDRRRAHRIAAAFRSFGYEFITVDIEGYRTGSLNEPLGLSTRSRRTPNTT